MITDFVRSPFFILRCVEFLFCIICFSLCTHHYETEIAMFDHKVVNLPRLNISDVHFDIEHNGFVKLHFLSIATSGYTWVILPVILISYINEHKYMANGFTTILLSFFGFLTFIVTGSLICSNFTGSSYTGALAAGAFCLITSFVFLGDFGFSLWTKLRTK